MVTRAIALQPTADGTMIIGNTIFKNDRGIVWPNNTVNVSVLKNTTVYNTGHAIDISANGSSALLHNNIISHNGGAGIDGTDAKFISRSHNDYFLNTGGLCTGGLTEGTGGLTADPQFINAAIDDYRLLSTSPLIDAGTPTGDDYNGDLLPTTTGPTRIRGCRNRPKHRTLSGGEN